MSPCLRSLVSRDLLKEKLKADVKEALKAGDSNRRTVLGMVLSAIQNKELEKRAKAAKVEGGSDLATAGELTDDEVLAVVASEVKKRKESIAVFEQGGRPELAADEKKEVELLSGYLPEQLSKAALQTLVQEGITATGATTIKDMGKVVGYVMGKAKSAADGQVVSALVKEELGV